MDLLDLTAQKVPNDLRCKYVAPLFAFGRFLLHIS